MFTDWSQARRVLPNTLRFFERFFWTKIRPTKGITYHKKSVCILTPHFRSLVPGNTQKFFRRRDTICRLKMMVKSGLEKNHF